MGLLFYGIHILSVCLQFYILKLRDKINIWVVFGLAKIVSTRGNKTYTFLNPASFLINAPFVA
jgi:hypothetical protein